MSSWFRRFVIEEKYSVKTYIMYIILNNV